MANNANLKPFQKNDPRINRKGRPKTFDAFRELAQRIAHEPAKSSGAPLVIDGHVVTLCEAILRDWANSKNPQLQKAFVEIAFGKVPENAYEFNLDVTKLSDEQLERIANGEDPARVMAGIK